MTFSGCVLSLLEEQEVPLLRRVTRQAQRADRRQRGPAHREKVILIEEALILHRSPTINALLHGWLMIFGLINWLNDLK